MFKTVRSKFTLGYLSLVLVICFLGVVSIYTMSSISTTIEGLITTNYNSIDRLSRMRDALWNQRLAVEEYLYGVSVTGAGERSRQVRAPWVSSKAKSMLKTSVWQKREESQKIAAAICPEARLPVFWERLNMKTRSRPSRMDCTRPAPRRARERSLRARARASFSIVRSPPVRSPFPLLF